MSIESKLSGHWTDDELIQHLYGVGRGDGHADVCAECRARLSAAQAHRSALEADASAHETAGHEFLMAQRRRIYARLNEPARWWTNIPTVRWASAAASLLVLAGSMLVYQHKVRVEAAADAELARDVSRMASDSEPPSTAPLQALFEE
jgi:hypothetical protein